MDSRLILLDNDHPLGTLYAIEGLNEKRFQVIANTDFFAPEVIIYELQVFDAERKLWWLGSDNPPFLNIGIPLFVEQQRNSDNDTLLSNWLNQLIPNLR